MNKENFHKGIKILVYGWAARLGFLAVGTLITTVFEAMDPSSYNLLPLHKPQMTLWKKMVNSDFTDLRYALKQQREPKLMKGAEVASHQMIMGLFRNVVPIKQMQVKISESAQFTHFAHDRLWSKGYNTSYIYISLATFLKAETTGSEYYEPFQYLDQLRPIYTAMVEPTLQSITENNANNPKTCSSGDDNGCTQYQYERKLKYFYATFPNAVPLAHALSSGFAPLIKLMPNNVPQMCLWLSSQGSSASLHYDIQDNFLLQVAGTKTVTLISPAALEYLRPFPSLHPYWRQSYYHEFSTAKEVNNLVSYNIFQHKHSHNSSSGKPYADMVRASGHGGGIYGQTNIWSVELNAGDVVFIPAGYYHAVSAGKDSISLNAWFDSPMSIFADGLDSIPLPFVQSEQEIQKLAKLGAVMRLVLSHVGLLVDSFVAVFMDRYDLLLPNSWSSASTLLGDINRGETNAPFAIMCGDTDIAGLAFENEEVFAVATQIHTLLTRSELSDPALISITLMDYIEDVLQIIWGWSADTPSTKLSHSKDDLTEIGRSSTTLVTAASVMSFAYSCIGSVDN